MNKRIKYIAVLCMIATIISCNEKNQVETGTHFYIANSFSPNNDGLNDRFIVYPIVGYVIRNYHISIYDQSLRMVYQSNDINVGWDGQLNGSDVPQGYYDYQILYEASQLLDSTSTDTVYSNYITSSNINLFRE